MPVRKRKSKSMFELLQEQVLLLHSKLIRRGQGGSVGGLTQACEVHIHLATSASTLKKGNKEIKQPFAGGKGRLGLRARVLFPSEKVKGHSGKSGFQSTSRSFSECFSLLPSGPASAVTSPKSCGLYFYRPASQTAPRVHHLDCAEELR